MKRIAVLALTAVMILPVAAMAGGRFSLGPRVGYYKAQDADEGKLFAGAAARLHLTSALGVEGSVDFRKEEYMRGRMTVTSWPVMVTGLVYPLPILYGLIGAGWYNSKVEYTPLAGLLAGEPENEQQFGWHFGLGLEIPLGSLCLAGDVRYVFLDYDFSAVPGSEEVKADFYAATLGLLIRL
ncbi:MAG: outer membrane beta-barrel protein [Calditrichaeota bacterium]|nr:outer membrane beta-barrel protein [Calditrichota bacterium]